eukprot:366281-Chlamydomonas_euryale.AAC.4
MGWQVACRWHRWGSHWHAGGKEGVVGGMQVARMGWGGHWYAGGKEGLGVGDDANAAAPVAAAVAAAAAAVPATPAAPAAVASGCGCAHGCAVVVMVVVRLLLLSCFPQRSGPGQSEGKEGGEEEGRKEEGGRLKVAYYPAPDRAPRSPPCRPKASGKAAAVRSQWWKQPRRLTFRRDPCHLWHPARPTTHGTTPRAAGSRGMHPAPCLAGHGRQSDGGKNAHTDIGLQQR